MLVYDFIVLQALGAIQKDENVHRKQMEAFRALDKFIKHANNAMIKGMLG